MYCHCGRNWLAIFLNGWLILMYRAQGAMVLYVYCFCIFKTTIAAATKQSATSTLRRKWCPGLLSYMEFLMKFASYPKDGKIIGVELKFDSSLSFMISWSLLEKDWYIEKLKHKGWGLCETSTVWIAAVLKLQTCIQLYYTVYGRSHLYFTIIMYERNKLCNCL